jgi:hypothetical protein
MGGEGGLPHGVAVRVWVNPVSVPGMASNFSIKIQGLGQCTCTAHRQTDSSRRGCFEGSREVLYCCQAGLKYAVV